LVAPDGNEKGARRARVSQVIAVGWCGARTVGYGPPGGQGGRVGPTCRPGHPAGRRAGARAMGAAVGGPALETRPTERHRRAPRGAFLAPRSAAQGAPRWATSHAPCRAAAPPSQCWGRRHYHCGRRPQSRARPRTPARPRTLARARITETGAGRAGWSGGAGALQASCGPGAVLP